MKNNIGEQVRAYYGEIAKKMSADSKSSCGCGTSCCGDVACCSSYLYTNDFIDGLPEEVVMHHWDVQTLLRLRIYVRVKLCWTWEVVVE